MPLLYSKGAGRHQPKTLFVDEFIYRRDNGILSPTSEALGFKTWVDNIIRAPLLIEENQERYLDSFRKHWPIVVWQFAAKFNIDAYSLTTSLRLSPPKPIPSSSAPPASSLPVVEEATPSPTMATFRPTLQVNGLPSVSENSPTATSTTGPSSQRDAMKLNMLKRMRPPPFTYAWSFYHDKHSTSSNYEGRLTLLLENIITLKPFWESFNNYPVEQLKMKDSIHFFKRGVKPVWEDPRNVKGGAWTFRVAKDKSKEIWKEVLLFAVGDQFADVIQPKDDLCGVSLSVRFNSNLITIWNRDGNNQKSIDGILAVVLDKLSPKLKPKEGTYYYKRHSEHSGFSEVVAKANEAEDAKRAKEVTKLNSGKIEEAEVKQDEVDKALMEEVAAAEAEGRSVEA